jgi:hypothetical protein
MQDRRSRMSLQLHPGYVLLVRLAHESQGTARPRGTEADGLPARMEPERHDMLSSRRENAQGGRNACHA